MVKDTSYLKQGRGGTLLETKWLREQGLTGGKSPSRSHKLGRTIEAKKEKGEKGGEKKILPQARTWGKVYW